MSATPDEKDEISREGLVEWLLDLSERLDGLRNEIDYVVENIDQMLVATEAREQAVEQSMKLAVMAEVALPFLVSHLPKLALTRITELVRVEQSEGREADLKYHHVWYAAAVCDSGLGPIFVSVEREEVDGELVRLIPDYWGADCLGAQP